MVRGMRIVINWAIEWNIISLTFCQFSKSSYMYNWTCEVDLFITSIIKLSTLILNVTFIANRFTINMKFTSKDTFWSVDKIFANTFKDFVRLPGTLCCTSTLILQPGFITLVEMDLDSASINLFLYIYAWNILLLLKKTAIPMEVICWSHLFINFTNCRDLFREFCSCLLQASPFVCLLLTWKSWFKCFRILTSFWLLLIIWYWSYLAIIFLCSLHTSGARKSKISLYILWT